MNIQKTAVNLIGLCVPFPKARRRIKQRLMRQDIVSKIYFSRFSKSSVRPKEVCLVELNACHGEVLAGFVPLLKKAGYANVDIILNAAVYKEKPFCRLNMDGVRIYKSTLDMFPLFIKSQRIKKYQYLFLMSSACYHIPDVGCDYSNAVPLFTKNGLHPYVIEHDLMDVSRFGEEDFLLKRRLITLGKFGRGVFINPHEFGSVEDYRNKKITTFITVGNIEYKRRNFHSLIDAAEKLLKQRDDFRIIVIGKGTPENIPASIKSHIFFTGRLNFPAMYDHLEKSDFFLPLLDSNNPLHDRYITTGVTGSAQLIYGFCIPPIIEKKFAKFYRFNDNNSIIYGKDLSEGMLKAMNMPYEARLNKRGELMKTANEITEESVKNLKELLGDERK